MPESKSEKLDTHRTADAPVMILLYIL